MFEEQEEVVTNPDELDELSGACDIVAHPNPEVGIPRFKFEDCVWLRLDDLAAVIRAQQIHETPTGFVLRYDHSVDGERLRIKKDNRATRVTILRTACSLGGTRPWYECPTCKRRVAMICLRPGVLSTPALELFCFECGHINPQFTKRADRKLRQRVAQLEAELDSLRVQKIATISQ